jgi:hypothetical protein
MKKALLVLTALASLTIAGIANDVVYQVGNARVSRQAGNAIAVEGATYVIVPIMAKNTTSKEISIGGMFGGNFKITQGEFSYDADGGVGWTFANEGYYDGLETLVPLIPKKFQVAFTVPLELATGSWTLTRPDGESVPLESTAAVKQIVRQQDAEDTIKDVLRSPLAEATPVPTAPTRPRSGKLIRSPLPPYPRKALKMHITGNCTVSITVKDGHITNVSPVSGPSTLCSFTARWVHDNWEFSPNTTGTFTLPVSFTMH